MAWKAPLGCALSAYEGVRLRQPAHERRASVTAGFAYARVRCVTALGRSHAVGAAESGHGAGGRAPVPPQPTGRRQGSLRRCVAALGPQTRLISASFSRFACLFCPLSGPVCALQHLTVAPTRRQAHPQRPCRPPGRSRSRSRRHRACFWVRWPPAALLQRQSKSECFCC